MKNNIKHGLLFLGASIICAILFLYLWNTQILDDIISDKGPLTLEGSPNAIRMGFCHCIIQWILFIATFVLAITATFGNEREDYSNIKKKWIVIPGIIILCWFISPIGAIIKLYNKNIPISQTSNSMLVKCSSINYGKCIFRSMKFVN